MKHKFELALRTKVIIVTDCGRPGTVEKRKSGMYLGGTEAYFVRRESDGRTEWYPRFSLALEEQQSATAKTEVTILIDENLIKGKVGLI